MYLFIINLQEKQSIACKLWTS